MIDYEDGYRDGYELATKDAAKVAAETAEAWGDLSLAPGVGKRVMHRLVSDILALRAPPADAPRCPHANVAKEPAKGRRVCRDCGMVAPDVRPEGTPEWQPADAPRDEYGRGVEDAAKVRCPHCGAEPGNLCKGPGVVRFHHAQRRGVAAAPFPTALVYWGAWPWLFHEVFSPRGRVVVP